MILYGLFELVSHFQDIYAKLTVVCWHWCFTSSVGLLRPKFRQVWH